MTPDRLPSWRPGAARDAILDYLDAIGDVPIQDRVAYVDNDGTMWCERPRYIQLDFFLDELRRRAADDPSLLERPEFGAVLRGDTVAMGELRLAKTGGALAGLSTVTAHRSSVPRWTSSSSTTAIRSSICPSRRWSTSRCSS